jgi:hypothetical protein
LLHCFIIGHFFKDLHSYWILCKMLGFVYLFIYLFVIYCYGQDQIQGLIHAGQVIHHWATSPAPKCWSWLLLMMPASSLFPLEICCPLAAVSLQSLQFGGGKHLGMSLLGSHILIKTRTQPPSPRQQSTIKSTQTEIEEHDGPHHHGGKTWKDTFRQMWKILAIKGIL